MSVQQLHDANTGYYGRPIVKPPEWTALIPTYFWAGGWAGASATLALAARVSRNPLAARALTLSAACGAAISAVCLIGDLKQPRRFHHMLRVFKPTSPMSVGVYLFSIFGGAAMTAALSELTGIATPVGRAGETVAGVTGPLMSVYTSVLISDTVMPAWHYARKSMPLLFAATSAATAGGLGMCLIPPAAAKPARRLALLGGAAVPFALQRLHAELGTFQSEPYRTGKAGRLSHLARIFNAGGTFCTLLARRSERIAQIGGAFLLAAGLAERFAVYYAGKHSAEDPKFTIQAQEHA